MKWRNERRSSNVEDQRGGRKALPAIGIGTVIIALVYFIMGGDPSALLQGDSNTNKTEQTDYVVSEQEQELADMSSAVLASTEDIWGDIFKKRGETYQEPKLVLFTKEVQSACGFADAATGPFYCGADAKVYLDLSFFEDLGRQFGAPGDFAQAYVIAHEVGHHIQMLDGTLQRVHQQQQNLSEAEANELSVRLELQADFYAGIWAHYADKYKKMIEAGDIDEALNAASQIGDDRLQMQGQGYVVPETFTHGTSAQRSKWFKRGYETGDVSKGNTFDVENL